VAVKIDELLPGAFPPSRFRGVEGDYLEREVSRIDNNDEITIVSHKAPERKRNRIANCRIGMNG
jgi:hypothetical protein